MNVSETMEIRSLMSRVPENHFKLAVALHRAAFSGNISSIATFYRASSYASAVLAVVILSVRPSVCLSVTRVVCNTTKQCIADNLITHEGTITLVFWYRQ